MPLRLRSLSSDLPFTRTRNTSIFFCSIGIEDDAGSQTFLHIESLGHALHAFINGKLVGKIKLKATTSDDNVFISLHRKILYVTLWTTFSGSGTGNNNKVKVVVDIPIKLVTGKNIIDLLSLTMGLHVWLYFLCCI